MNLKKKCYYSVPGSPLKVTYSPKVSPSGSVHLVATGEVDLYMEIQSHKQSVDLKSLIARFESGDVDVLNRKSGFFADVSGFPQTYSELHQLMTDARSHFDALPVDVRKRFDFDFGKYLESLGDIPSAVPSSESATSSVPEKESEVKTDEQER